MLGGVIVDQRLNPTLGDDSPRIIPRDWRRRSADVGGLHLATTGLGQGQGWMGGDSLPVETIYAELLGDMYTETVNSVNDNSVELIPPAVSESVRSRLIHSLDRWHFEPHKLPEEEVLTCTLILFETLFRIEGLAEVIPVNMEQLTSFIHHLRRIYRYENTYHNFEHALDVLQASQCYLKSAGIVPSPTILFEPNRLWKPNKQFNSGSLVSSLGLRELFLLYVAAIGHDVGHPGFSNMFMKNANAPLSLIFDHSSALEQMHYQLLLRVMRHHGLGVLLDDPKHGNHCRDIIRSTVIATDMSVHSDFMQRFKRLIEGEAGSICQRQTIICQAILKNADISNPSRPFYVSTHWAKALMQEWSAQANLEQEYDLKPTVMSSSDPIKEAESQLFFINTFVKPMLELTVKAIPELACYLFHLKSNQRTWIKRKAELVKASKLPLPRQINASQPALRSKSSKSTVNPPPASAPPSFNSVPLTSGKSDDLTSHPVLETLVSPTQSPPPPSTSSSSLASPFSPLTTSPRNQTDAFMNAFPLTLPTYPPKISFTSDTGHVWVHTTSSSTSSSRSVSEHDSVPPDSPSAASELSSFSCAHPQSPLFSPLSAASMVSEGSHSYSSVPSGQHPSQPHRCPSNASLASVVSNGGKSKSGNVTAMSTAVDGPHLTSPHEAIRTASRLGSLRQRRQKDAPAPQPGLSELFTAMDNNGNLPLTTVKNGARKAWRNSWSSGMPGEIAAVFQQAHPPLSRIPSNASTVAPSPSILPPSIPLSLDSVPDHCENTTSSVPDILSPSSSASSPASDTSPRTPSQPPSPTIVMPRRLSPPIKLQALQVSSP